MGSGKSTLANFLVDGEDSNRFETSNSTGGGVTKKIQSARGFALGEKSLSKKVQVFDLPGLADPDMPMMEWIDEIQRGIDSNENIDMGLMVMKSQDY